MSCENEEKCFTITWKIENFSSYLSSSELSLRSPVWKTDTTEDSAFWMVLVFNNDTKFMFYLINLKGENKKNHSRYEMTLLTPCGESSMNKEATSNNSCSSSCSSIEKNKIFGNTSDTLIVDDSLTFCCRIRQQTIKFGQCLLRTVLHKVNFLWSIEGIIFEWNFQRRTLHQQEPLLLSAILFRSNEKGTHKVRVEFIPIPGIQSAFLSCKIDIKDAGGRVLSNSKDYPGASWSWGIEICSGSSTSNSLLLEIQTLVAVNMDYPQLTIHPRAVLSSSDTLSDDLLLLFTEGFHCDATLNTEGKSFTAHRGILAARSPVFRAMFEKDEMNEGRSGVVDIDDVDSETVDRMLVFLYGGLLEELQWEEAFPLYYAADKYDVLPLKQKCADILKAGLAVDKACDLLVLADKHSDEQLMTSTVDFLHGHVEVFSSSAWKSLEKSHPQLIIKTFRELYLRGNK